MEDNKVERVLDGMVDRVLAYKPAGGSKRKKGKAASRSRKTKPPVKGKGAVCRGNSLLP